MSKVPKAGKGKQNPSHLVIPDFSLHERISRAGSVASVSFFSLQAEMHQKYVSEFILNSFLYFQLRTAMVKGETGTLSLNIRASVDKGVILMSQSVDRRVCLLRVPINCSITDKMILSATEKAAVPHQRIFLHQHR